MRVFTARQAEGIRIALRRAERRSGLRFSVYAGRAEGPARAFARRLHAALGPDAGAAVLIFVDPRACVLEIVTGAEARTRLPDSDCRAAGVAIATACGIGDVAGGITLGLQTLADRAARTTHPA